MIAGLMLGFTACEQEHVIEDLSAITESSMTENRDNGELSCGTVPSKEQIEYLNKTRKARQVFSLESMKDQTVYVPIVNHIIRQSNGTGGLSTATLAAAIQGLNDAYEDAHIQFFECQSINYIDNSALYNFNSSQEPSVTPNDVADVINIYHFNSITNLCGYTTYPPGADRVFMSNVCVSNGSTLIHELGHYLSLYHTHGPYGCGSGIPELVERSNCHEAGDEICDTNADPCLSNSVDANCVYTGGAVDANGDAYDPPTTNFMSYSRKSCRTEFTNEQRANMLFTLLGARSYLTCNAQMGSITWTYHNSGWWSVFNVCVEPYEGTIHQFRHRTRSSLFNGVVGEWVYRSSTTNPCFSIIPGSCYYDVQVRIKGINGDWGDWSDSEILKCAVDK